MKVTWEFSTRSAFNNSGRHGTLLCRAAPSPRPLFTLNFSRVLSYVIALEPDKKPVEVLFSFFFVAADTDLGVSQCTTAHYFAPTRDGLTGERLAGSPLQLRLTWVNSTASLPSLYPTLPFLWKDIMVLCSPPPETIELVDTARHSGA